MNWRRHVHGSTLLAGAATAALALWGGPTILGVGGLAILIGLILLFPIVGVGALLVISPIYLILTPFIPKGIPVSFLLLALTLVGLAMRRVIEPRSRPFRWTMVDRAVAFLLLNGLIYLPLSGNLTVGVYGYHELFRLFLLYFIVRLLAPARSASTSLLIAILVTSFGVLLYGVIQHFWNYEYIMSRFGLARSLHDYAGFNRAGIRRSYSVTSSPLTLGFMAMLAALGALAVLLGGRRRDGAAGWAPLLLVTALAAAAFSYTRSAWLGVAAGFVVALLIFTRGRARLWLILSPVILLLGVGRFLPDVAGRLGRYALTIFSRDPAETSFHYVALLQAASYFWANKLGVGLGEATFAGFHHGQGVQIWSENAFFLVGIQTGIQGFLAFIAFVGLAGSAGHSLFRRPDAGAWERRLGLAVALGFIGFTVGGMSLPAILDAASFGPLWVMLALAVNAGQELEAGADGAPAPA